MAKASRVTSLAALALFDDREKGSDVLGRLNKTVGSWAADVFRDCREGAHQEVAGDLKGIIRDAEKLTTTILGMK